MDAIITCRVEGMEWADKRPIFCRIFVSVECGAFRLQTEDAVGPPRLMEAGQPDAVLQALRKHETSSVGYQGQAFSRLLEAWKAGGAISFNGRPMPSDEVGAFMREHMRARAAEAEAMERSEAARRMGHLEGARILGLRVSEGDMALAFDTDRGVVVYRAVSDDDRSDTWFAEVAGVEALLGQVVMTTEAVEMPAADDGRSRQDCDIPYGIKLATALGHADIVFRNSSNGYYGGELMLGGEADLVAMRPILADWQAGSHRRMAGPPRAPRRREDATSPRRRRHG